MPRKLLPGPLVIASHNPGKVREITALLGSFGIEPVSAGSLGLSEPEETGTTFRANAELKALASATATGMPALADDSGLCVDALGGAPGIYSARWAGDGKDFALAMRRVHDEMIAAGVTAMAGTTAPAGVALQANTTDAAAGVASLATDAAAGTSLASADADAAAGAHFVCALSLGWPDGHVDTFEGKIFGRLVWPPRGERGFGFDPMFVPDGYDVTFGEMDPDHKHAISHRAKAFEQLVAAVF